MNLVKKTSRITDIWGIASGLVMVEDTVFGDKQTAPFASLNLDDIDNAHPLFEVMGYLIVVKLTDMDRTTALQFMLSGRNPCLYGVTDFCPIKYHVWESYSTGLVLAVSKSKACLFYDTVNCSYASLVGVNRFNGDIGYTLGLKNVKYVE